MHDVIVIGAGIGGAAAAYFLGKADQYLFYGLPRLCFLRSVYNPRMVQTFVDMLDERASYFDISKYIPLALLGVSRQRPTYVKPGQRKGKVGGSSEETTAR